MSRQGQLAQHVCLGLGVKFRVHFLLFCFVFFMGPFRTAETVRIPYQDEPMVGAFAGVRV